MTLPDLLSARQIRYPQPIAWIGAPLQNAPELTFVHVFTFQWKAGTIEQQQREAEQQIRAFRNIIPGLLKMHVGRNLSPRNGGYTFGGVMYFTDRAAFQEYETHSAHMALLAWLVPLIDAVEIDLEA